MAGMSGVMDNLSGILNKVMGTRGDEPPAPPGPATVGPTTKESGKPDQRQKTLIVGELSKDQMDAWWREVDMARLRRKTRAEEWDVLLDEYMPIVIKSGTPEALKVQKHFRNVHSKIGQLFYRTPDVVLEPLEPGPVNNQMPNPLQAMMPQMPLPPIEMKDIVSVKQAVLNKKLGKDGIKMHRLMDELLFDVLAWAGFGVAKIGYRCVSKPMQRPVMGPPPPMPGDVLGLGGPVEPVEQMGPDGQPMMETVDSIVYEDYYARRISPKKALWSPYHNSSRFDEDAAWVGFEFFLSKQDAMKKFDLKEEDLGATAKDELIHKYIQDSSVTSTGPKDGLVHGIEIWCKSALYTPDQPHPQAVHQLVLIEGMKTRPAVWRPSPDQDFDGMGRLSKDSVTGFPIRFLTIRDLADSSFTPSDAAFTNSGIKELTTYRRQGIMLRDAQIGHYFYDGGKLSRHEVQSINGSPIGSWHELEEGALAGGIDKLMGVSPQVKAGADDYRGQEILNRELDETLGISSTQAGVPEQTVRTATEIANVQTAVAARNEKEQSRAVEFYVDAARMVDKLLMRYATQEDYINITGNDGAQRIMVWNNQIIGGDFLYDIAPDSQLKIDTFRDKERMQRLYNLTSKDPLCNRSYLLQRIFRAEGLDPSKAILDPMAQLMQAQHGGEANVANKSQAGDSGGRPNEPGAGDHRAAQGSQISGGDDVSGRKV